MARVRKQTSQPTIVEMQTPTNVTVGIVSAEILAANDNRSFLILFNESNTATIYLAFGVAAIVNRGIVIPPQSAFVFDRLAISVQQIRAIATAAATPLSIQEGH